MVGFDGVHGLWGDLATGKVPNLSYIVPNQCNACMAALIS
jgi:hypothetical protein